MFTAAESEVVAFVTAPFSYTPLGDQPINELEVKKMPDRVYKKTEVVGSSKDSVEDAIRNAVQRTSKSIHNVEWFEVQEVRGDVIDGEVAHFQVALKIGFRLD